MDKTVIVLVERTKRHPLYRKILKRTKRYMAHDDRLGAKPGDLVRILETRPLSRHKRWRVAEILARGEVAEIAPKEIDAEYLTLQRERQAPPPPRAAADDETFEGGEPEAGGEMPAANPEAGDAPVAEVATEHTGDEGGGAAGDDEEEPAP
jgi:small subunit ribosomal protein S17